MISMILCVVDHYNSPQMLKLTQKKLVSLQGNQIIIWVFKYVFNCWILYWQLTYPGLCRNERLFLWVCMSLLYSTLSCQTFDMLFIFSLKFLMTWKEAVWFPTTTTRFTVHHNPKTARFFYPSKPLAFSIHQNHSLFLSIKTPRFFYPSKPLAFSIHQNPNTTRFPVHDNSKTLYMYLCNG